MPVHKAPGGGYQWGHQKVYRGKGAKGKAAKQGRAVAISKARKAGHKIPYKNECATDDHKKKKMMKNCLIDDIYPSVQSIANFRIVKK